MSIVEEGVKVRKPENKINDLILGRWSPRAMSGEEISDEELMPLLEAARWAPSAFNEQPWRFIIAKRNTPEWEPVFNLLNEFNQAWTKNAAALVLVLSRKNSTHNEKPFPTHSFDTGAAWENLALEGTSKNIVVHGMSGFDYEKTQKDLEIPEVFQVEAMFAIGKPGKKEDLSEEMQKRESPSERKPLKELIFKGKYGIKYTS